MMRRASAAATVGSHRANSLSAAVSWCNRAHVVVGPPLRMGELVATLALAQDNAFGQPLESQLRSCLLAVWLGEEAGFDRELRDTVYWVALLRYIGCTGHAHEVSTLFGDEIAIRAADAGARRRQPGRGDPRRDRVRDRRPAARGARADRPDDPGGRPGVGGAQLHLGLRGGRHAGRSASASARPYGTPCASRSSAGTAPATPATRAGRRSPWPCASCTSATTWRRTAGSSRRTRRSRPPATAAGSTYDPELADLFVRARGGLVRPARHGRALGRRARPRARAAPHPGGGRARRGPHGGRRLHRPEVPVHVRATAAGARSSPPTPRASSGSPSAERRRRSGGPPSCTRSARPSCRTRSGTSPARSRAPSSTASSSTRCSPSRCCAARRPC